MTATHHGFAITLIRLGEQYAIQMRASGRLTHADYQQITPLLEEALAQVDHPEVDLLFDATEFTGWEPRAAWADLKIGLKHHRVFRKIALYGDLHGWNWLAAIGNALFHAQIRCFDSQTQALEWLSE